MNPRPSDRPAEPGETYTTCPGTADTLENCPNSAFSRARLDSDAKCTYPAAYPLANTEIGDGCPAPRAAAPGPRPGRHGAAVRGFGMAGCRQAAAGEGAAGPCGA